MQSVHIESFSNGISFKMIYVEGGAFDMGSNHESSFREDPIHKVQVDSFYVGKFPVTQAVWKAVMGSENNPSFFQGDDRPVEQVSWDDYQNFIKKLHAITGKSYRLSTEAEWEYAALGGQKSQGYLYAGSNKLEEVGWFVGNSDAETKSVGQKKPNELGIYDMSGNVWEWCKDWISDKYYEACSEEGVVKNPQGPVAGINRVMRGGGWSSHSEFCRSTFRDSYSAKIRDFSIGFRLILSPS